jgi:hypothetical protein
MLLISENASYNDDPMHHIHVAEDLGYDDAITVPDDARDMNQCGDFVRWFNSTKSCFTWGY